MSGPPRATPAASAALSARRRSSRNQTIAGVDKELLAADGLMSERDVALRGNANPWCRLSGEKQPFRRSIPTWIDVGHRSAANVYTREPGERRYESRYRLGFLSSS